MNGVLERLYQLAPRGAVLGLERMRDACRVVGDPQRRFASVHVAGTNGKGSVCAMVAAMARADGRRVGLYTSPHLCRFNERIQVDGEPANDDMLLPALAEVLDRCPELTFFETATMAAFLIFARLAVDVAIVEVGLGGRLDATNVLEAPRATAITQIALDHTDRLGGDIPTIAGEKAGILKPGVPAFVGALVPEALAVVQKRAKDIGAPLRPTDDPELASFVDAHPPALGGAHQRENARIAVAIARELALSPSSNAQGLHRVTWPGRFETLSTQEGPVLLDAAHNPAGARALAAALREKSLRPAEVALVFGSMADKDYRTMLAELAPLADHRVYVMPEGRRAADPQNLARLAAGATAGSAADAMREARAKVGAAGLVVVSGSIFLVGAVRALLLGLRRDPPVAL